MLSNYAHAKVDPHKPIGSNEAQVFLNYHIQFGKHAGKSLNWLIQNDPNYVNWLLSQPTSANANFSDAQNMLKALSLWGNKEVPDEPEQKTEDILALKSVPSKASASMLADAMLFIWISSTKLTAGDFAEEYQEQYKVLLNDFVEADTDTFLVIKNSSVGFKIETYYTKEVLLHGGGKWNV
jgi:hypothetical protein